jgi:hypothetical protein
VLKGANLDVANGAFELWYSDEHALALGVRQVNVITASGGITTTNTTNYAVTPLTSNPGSAVNPAVGSAATSGDQAGSDLSGRPITPSLYITDITNNPLSRSGDWQYGGTGYTPGAAFGTWKGVVRTVNYTTGATPTVTVTCDADPAKNGWNLGPGSDAAPAGLGNEGYGAEARWSLTDMQNAGILIPGHTYRFYVIVHDGDQNKSGGDCGQAVFTYVFPGTAPPPPASLSGYVMQDNSALGTPNTGIGYVTVTLTGMTNSGQSVTMVAMTDGTGYYHFDNLQAGTYTVTQTDPAGFNFESDTVGTGATMDGNAGTDNINGIVLSAGDTGINFNFLDNQPTGPGA